MNQLNQLNQANQTNETPDLKIRKTRVNGREVSIVSAREIFDFLPNTSNFRRWIFSRIKAFSLEENKDYVVDFINHGQGRPYKDFLLHPAVAIAICGSLSSIQGKLLAKSLINSQGTL